MLYPLIGRRLHGWLDDVVVLIYLLGVFALPLHGTARAVGLAGAAVHFLLTRLTDYPQGTIKLIPFRVHAYIELMEGLGVLAATLASVHAGTHQPVARAFLIFMGLSQLGAFAFSDYGPGRRAASME